MNLFADDVIPEDWDGELHLSTIKGKTDWRRTLSALPCGDGFIKPGFVFNGASVGPFRRFFPKWKHPIATCRHDIRCNEADRYKQIAKQYPYFSSNAKYHRGVYKRLRRIADTKFWKDVSIGGTKWEQIKGYAGVRIGAFF